MSDSYAWLKQLMDEAVEKYDREIEEQLFNSANSGTIGSPYQWRRNWQVEAANEVEEEINDVKWD